jgi:hypothetical protein
MKSRNRPLWICLAILLAVVAIWFAKHFTKTPARGANSLVPQQGTVRPNGRPGALSTNATAFEVAVAKVKNALTAPSESKEQKMAGILSTQNDIPILFYGRLEDQFGEPVVDAEVAGNTIIYNGRGAGGEHVSVKSAAAGRFKIEAGKGESLGIMPRKEGYALASTGTEFKYSHLYQDYHVPNPGDPVVIKMWKLQGAQPLVGLDQNYKLRYTTDPIYVDLIDRKIVPYGGDVKITVKRSIGELSLRNRADWSFTVEAVAGGLIDSSGQEAVTYWAPESGYQSNLSIFMSATPPLKWFDSFNQGVFFTSRNGQIYGKLGISFRINGTPEDLMYLNFGGIANTNYSRNLEGDPNTYRPR